MKQQNDKTSFLAGLRDGVPIGLGYFAREFDTSKLKRILQSLETGLFFCQIFVFII